MLLRARVRTYAPLQCSRGLSTAEGWERPAELAARSALQCSRGLSTAEGLAAPVTHFLHCQASMQPRSFNRGRDATGLRHRTEAIELQCSRGLSTAEGQSQHIQAADRQDASMQP